MRQTKFRGINEYGHMITGFLSMNCEFEYVISEPFEHAPTMNDPCGGADMSYDVVDENTIGQFTGLTDKIGVDIYEGDIVSQEINCMYHAGRHNKEIRFSNDQFLSGDCSRHGAVTNFDAEVIGNIHQHPELMEQNSCK